MTLILKQNKMKNLTIKRQENKTIETNVVYELPAFFRNGNEVFGVYSSEKVVSIMHLDLINNVRIEVRSADKFSTELSSATEITEIEFIEVYEKSIGIVEQSSCLVYGRTRYDELQDRESEMRDIEMEVNEAIGEMEC